MAYASNGDCKQVTMNTIMNTGGDGAAAAASSSGSEVDADLRDFKLVTDYTGIDDEVVQYAAGFAD